MARGGERKRQSARDKQAAKKPLEGNPKSMVIRIGAAEVGSSVSQLVHDVRQVMQPDTALRLKERRANKLRDYTTMCGPLGVSHLLLFSRSPAGNTNLRLARTPHGPTLHFRVEKYSLCKDIAKSMKHPRAGLNDFQVAPLLVMNNFLTSDADREKLGDSAPPKHLEKLVTDMFQGLFPPVQPHTTPLHTIKRVLLLNREPPSEDGNGTFTVSLRHYAITTKISGLPKPIRRLYAAEKLIGSREKRKHGLPNLGGLEDVADYMLDPSAAGYTSASETEMDTDAEVEVAAPITRKVMSKRDKERAKASATDPQKPRVNRPKVEKRAVKLVELGPRMKLRLTKVEEDICTGRVMWHEFMSKSKEEVKEMDEMWEQRKKEKEERRRIQKENIERKRKEKGEKGEGDEDEDEDEEIDYDEYDMDDDVWHDEDGENDEHDHDKEMEGDDE